MKRTNLRTKVERVLKRIESAQKRQDKASSYINAIIADAYESCAKMLRRALK